MVKIAPSFLAADFVALEREIRAVEAAGAEYIHLDVMDGHFVPNITFGPMVVEAIRKATTLILDVHLMIADPGRYLRDFADSGADICTVHVEVNADLPTLLGAIRENGHEARRHGEAGNTRGGVISPAAVAGPCAGHVGGTRIRRSGIYAGVTRKGPEIEGGGYASGHGRGD